MDIEIYPLPDWAERLNQELPYTVTPGSHDRLHASPTYEIPAWCPLEHN